MSNAMAVPEKEIKRELELASLCESFEDYQKQFHHLENAHVLGQHSTYWHTYVHWQMLKWGITHNSFKEIVGQIIRIIGAITKTPFGALPKGNTGGANVSPFKKMPLKPEHAEILKRYKN
ncbi:DUF3703 domain-containing protein [Alteromonas sp. ASW11-130]|uniref:DUF3703 domain-containing protein n=1 Tax=Alteromonas sp. ASW11-130 TaxID=3015775 RepID=UPI002241FD56|nr:DUF3703 domain-containing protein [Alteromonas sp. ASW11-130]MCW8093261.1 DUF3703 domain-containing protein [Alteromonas sp. ASW11-130]